MNEMLNHLGVNAKAAETEMRNLSTDKKNEVLLAVADRLVKDTQTLIRANAGRTDRSASPDREQNQGNGRRITAGCCFG